jgi:pimeloyl-ACP methyl ester carboxylesterase
MRLNLVRRGAGAPIVFVHGMGSSSATWEACMTALENQYEVVAIDLPGHGRSTVPDDPADYSRGRVLIYLDEVLAQFKQPAVLVGHSLGGYLALAHAATRPGLAKGIVVINTGPGFRNPNKRKDWNERILRNAHRFGLPVPVANLNLQEDSVVMDRLVHIMVPTLVLAGELDRVEYVAAGYYLERNMPSVRLVTIAGGEHSMHEATHAAEVARLIGEFVSKLPPD